MKLELKPGDYESKFEFPILKLIRQKAEELDISYCAAADIVVPEYQKTVRYRDHEFEHEVMMSNDAEFKQAIQEYYERKE
ncbi:MAG: hypothetical protein IJ106_11430 [Parasporobacterium sp.]|nr:hypothetical protein [Parasporobacterium sp.]